MVLRIPKRLSRQYNAQNRSPLQESELASRLKGRVTKGSGNKDEKGDVRVKGVLRLEAKCTESSSFRVTYDMVQKIEDAALGSAEMPVLLVEFMQNQGRAKKEVCVVPKYFLDTVIDVAE